MLSPASQAQSEDIKTTNTKKTLFTEHSVSSERLADQTATN
jgi:hypothetical protein